MLTNDDKQWIRDEIRSEVDPIKSDVTELKSDVTELKSDVTNLKSDVTELKSDVTELKSDVTELKSDVKELKSDVAILKNDMSDVKDSIQRINLQLENDLFPLLSEVASAYSGSDMVFQKRAESLGKLQEDTLINQQMIANHEIRIKTLEAEQKFKEIKEPVRNL